jgi:hypothetical protein
VPRYNTAPTDPLPVVTSANGKRRLELMRWGLVPYWSKDLKINFSTINARADSVATKPAFREAWQRGRRCLIVADGFYEWRKSDKQPFFISLGNRQPMLFAGLWEQWRPKEGEPVRSRAVRSKSRWLRVLDLNLLIPRSRNKNPCKVRLNSLFIRELGPRDGFAADCFLRHSDRWASTSPIDLTESAAFAGVFAFSRGSLKPGRV